MKHLSGSKTIIMAINLVRCKSLIQGISRFKVYQCIDYTPIQNKKFQVWGKKNLSVSINTISIMF